MPQKSMEVMVEPSILKWARESIGLNIEKVAKLLEVNSDIITKWESGQEKPTIRQLERLARVVYKRPLAVFFLSKAPEELPLPTDFRTLPTKKKVPFSPKTRLAIRRARRLQSLASQLASNLDQRNVLKLTKVNLSDDPEILSKKVREQLGIGIETQFNWKDEKEAFSSWKKVIENANIFIFQMGMPLVETRGFSLVESEFPSIVLNLRDSINGRIFSLFHEYSHIFLNKSGICDMEDQDSLSDEDRLTEQFCNHFAGAALVPKSELLNHELIKPILQDNVTLNKFYDQPEQVLAKLSKNFKVSKEVILRRLLIFRLTTRNYYEMKHGEWQEKILKKLEQKGGKQNPSKKCLQQNGVPFVSMVLSSHKQGKITTSDVSDYLSVRLKYLPEIEQFVEGKE